MGQNGAYLEPTGPRWAHVGPMNFAIWRLTSVTLSLSAVTVSMFVPIAVRAILTLTG